MYRPLRFFMILGGLLFLSGFLLGIRYLVYMSAGDSGGHVQSLILAAILILMGAQSFFTGLLSDIIAANRKLLEDVQYRVRKMETGEKTGYDCNNSESGAVTGEN